MWICYILVLSLIIGLPSGMAFPTPTSVKIIGLHDSWESPWTDEERARHKPPTRKPYYGEEVYAFSDPRWQGPWKDEDRAMHKPPTKKPYYGEEVYAFNDPRWKGPWTDEERAAEKAFQEKYQAKFKA